MSRRRLRARGPEPRRPCPRAKLPKLGGRGRVGVRCQLARCSEAKSRVEAPRLGGLNARESGGNGPRSALIVLTRVWSSVEGSHRL